MPARARRRAVGPPGARPSQAEPTSDGLDVGGRRDDEPRPPDGADEDERLRADRPPHHDRGV